MKQNLGLNEQQKKECAEALCKVLADTYLLYLKTHNFHWNVEGARFHSLHEMFEEQYRALWAVVDEVAERVRALDEYAPGTYAKFAHLASIKENEKVPAADDMIRELIADHETVTRTVRAALSVAQDAGDEASVTLLGDRLADHEKTLWMLRSTLK